MPPRIGLSRHELLEQHRERTTGDIRFPEARATHVIATFSAGGELVLDPFAVFGTTTLVVTGDARALARLVRCTFTGGSLADVPNR